MKVLLVNGSPNKNGCTYTALRELANSLEKNGIESEILYLGKSPLAGCTACGKCNETGECIFDDEVNKVVEKLDEYHGIVAGSPVYYAGPSGQICSFLERLFFVGGSQMKGKVCASVVSCRRGGATAAFDRLNKYFLMNNMILIGSSYWNMVHGHNPDEVRQDIEGLQTMRNLGENMSWVIKCIDNSLAKFPYPTLEEKIYTNYIR